MPLLFLGLVFFLLMSLIWLLWTIARCSGQSRW